jgi:hypothetical protein
MKKKKEGCEHVYIARKKSCGGWIEYRIVKDKALLPPIKETVRLTEFVCSLCGQIAYFPNYLDHIYSEKKSKSFASVWIKRHNRFLFFREQDG